MMDLARKYPVTFVFIGFSVVISLVAWGIGVASIWVGGDTGTRMADTASALGLPGAVVGIFALMTVGIREAP